MSAITTKNPYTQEDLKTYNLISDKELKQKLDLAEEQFQNWKSLQIKDRSKLLSNVAELLVERKESYAKLMTQEMGKPITQGIAEIEKCAWVCDFYAKNADDFLADQLIDADTYESFISYDPLGVILAIMPWNYPFWQVMRFAAPTLMAGNTALLKHASSTTQCAIEIEKLFEDAGFPKGCFQTLLVSHSQIETILNNDIVIEDVQLVPVGTTTDIIESYTEEDDAIIFDLLGRPSNKKGIQISDKGTILIIE